MFTLYDCMKALEGCRVGKGEAACTVLYSYKAYVTSQQCRVYRV
jgi:hypothetical protein